MRHVSHLNRIVDETRELRIFRQALARKFEATKNRHQQIVEVMGNAAGQLPDRFHFLRLKQRLAGTSSSLFSVLLIRDITRNLGKADQRAIFMADRVNDNTRPEARPILANAPAFIFEPPDIRRSRRVRWLAKLRCRSSSV